MTRQRGIGERRTAAGGSAAAAVVRLVAVGGVAGVAGAGEQAATAPAAGGTFDGRRRRRPGQPRPAPLGVRVDQRVNSFAYETLVYLGQDGEITPGLAESWEESPTSVTYTLKDGVTCADGTPLTATTVADNFSFVADPANQSPLLGLYVPPAITVEADDAARTVTLTSEAPVPFMLQNTGAGAVHRVRRGPRRSQHSSLRGRTAQVRSSSKRPSPTTTTRSAPGTTTRGGPTAPTSELPGFPSEVVVRIIENESTAANLLLSGEVNIASIAGADRQRVESEGYFVTEQPVDRR